eukprot:2916361-Prorocentrum_lima.AAC.1
MRALGSIGCSASRLRLYGEQASKVAKACSLGASPHVYLAALTTRTSDNPGVLYHKGVMEQ